MVLKDVDRVIMSAKANLAGLFPPIGNQIWMNDLDWQPVPVHTTPKSEDYLLASAKQCDHYDYVMLDFMNKSDYKKIFVEYQPLFSYLETNSGQNLSTLLLLSLLRDTLFVEQSTGKWYV